MICLAVISRHVLCKESKFPFASLHTPSAHTYGFLDDGLHPLFLHNIQKSSTLPQLQPDPNPCPISSPPNTQTVQYQPIPHVTPPPSPTRPPPSPPNTIAAS